MKNTLCNALGDYLADRISLDALRDIQVDVLLGAEEKRDGGVLRIADRMELLLAEYRLKHRSESDLREGFMGILRDASIFVVEVAAPAYLAGTSTNVQWMPHSAAA
ncbi:MAG: hypothetical protein O2968_18065 [Acidobacteria bacterium]|nr:hypothetical protein [Acidobacteriota bacterium]